MGEQQRADVPARPAQRREPEYPQNHERSAAEPHAFSEHSEEYA
jgi:hypothetical protein